MSIGDRVWVLYDDFMTTAFRVLDLDTELVAVARAWQHPNDPFIKKRGRSIATSRLASFVEYFKDTPRAQRLTGTRYKPIFEKGPAHLVLDVHEYEFWSKTVKPLLDRIRSDESKCPDVLASSLVLTLP